MVIASVTALGPAVKMDQNTGSILEPVVSGDGRLLVYHDGRTIKYVAESTDHPRRDPRDRRHRRPQRHHRDGLWTQGKMVVLDSRLNNSDLAILQANPPIHDRMIDLYTATPGGTRIGASNNFFINSIENALDYDADLRPSLPRDVVWQLSSTTGTDEVAFDDTLLRRALVISPMNPSVNNTAAALHKRDYNDGFNATGTFAGTGFILDPHVQNAATSVYWKIPAFGALLGGARVEPLAAGGAKGKGSGSTASTITSTTWCRPSPRAPT